MEVSIRYVGCLNTLSQWFLNLFTGPLENCESTGDFSVCCLAVVMSYAVGAKDENLNLFYKHLGRPTSVELV
jgi:hypothetical protein